MQMRKKLGAAKEKSEWWSFIPTWHGNIELWIQDFIIGKHQFSPMSQYEFKDAVARVWSYHDRLIMYLILKIIKSILDKAFTNRNGIFYLRFMDGIIVLVYNKRQYIKARKRLFEV
jgi:hypothetical protein